MSLRLYLKRVFKWVFSGVPIQNTTVVVKQIVPNELLKGRNIVVTGGSKGLGKEIAKKCAAEGAKVIICGRNEESLKQVADMLGSNVSYLVLDVNCITKFDAFFDEAENIFGGKVDSLVSNAGISLHEGNFRNVKESDWDKQFNTNLKGNYFLVQSFIRYLEKHEDRTGNIVVITSERAKRPDDIPYGLTKIASSSFIQCIARKVIAEGIRINGVGPGVTTTDMTGISKENNMYSDMQAGKRYFIPEEVAEVVNFLLCDASACISGEIITCDQGSYIVPWQG